MQSRGALEIEVRRSLIALSLDLPHQRLAAALQVLLHAPNLSRILLVGATFEARRQAHLHLGINAAGKGGIGIQVEGAAAHFEQVERVVGELLGSNPRGKWAEVLRVASQAADARGDGRARYFSTF